MWKGKQYLVKYRLSSNSLVIDSLDFGGILHLYRLVNIFGHYTPQTLILLLFKGVIRKSWYYKSRVNEGFIFWQTEPWNGNQDWFKYKVSSQREFPISAQGRLFPSNGNGWRWTLASQAVIRNIICLQKLKTALPLRKIFNKCYWI